MLPLDPTTTKFSWANARAGVEASADAYEFKSDIFDPYTDAECLVEDRGDCIVIAFKGSKEAKDFYQDAKFLLTDYDMPGGAKVHHGFLEDFNALAPGIHQKLKELSPKGIFIAGVYTFGCPRVGDAKFRELYNSAHPGFTAGTRPVFIFGHSLGGALAILCALDLARQFTGDPVMTLGEFTFDVVNQNDIVPRTPPLLMGYRRVGQKVFLFTGVGWGINPSLWMLLLSDALGFWLAYRKKCDVLITEHYIKAYQQRIQNL